MRNTLQPFLLQIYKQNLTNVKLGNTFRQSLACFGSDSPQYPSEPLEFGKISEANAENDVHDPGECDNIKHGKTIIRKNYSYQGNKPIKMTLASTNKMLFGPLLETSLEKKRRLKREARGVDETEHANKPKEKKKKKKGQSLVQPLILNPENSHYLSGDTELHLHEVTGTHFSFEEKLSLPHIDIKKSAPMFYNKKKIILKPKFDVEKTDHERLDLLSAKSVGFASHSKVVEPSISVCDKENKNIDNNDALSNTGIYHKPHRGIDWGHSYQEMRVPKREETPSFISVDNSKFTAVPQTLNIVEMESFPLFSDILTIKSNSVRDHMEEGNHVVSIGMFDGGYQKLPSVRKILEETMPQGNKIALEKWKAKMIKELGEKGFNQYRQDLLNRGKFLHECVQSELYGAPLGDEHTITVKELWQSLKPVLPSVSDVQVLESRLTHPYLYYQGAVDCIASYRGIPVLIEWKTSSKPKLSVKSMFDDPLQVVAYLGALNFDSNYRLPQPIESAMLVVAYESGLPAHVHLLKKEDCYNYWKIWCSRLCQFWKQKKSLATSVA